jgi:hypothetical protein
MRTLMRSASIRAFVFALVAFLTISSPLCCQPSAIRISLCRALAHPTEFDGKMVEFHAKYSGTTEGTWITDGDCGAGELMFPGDHNSALRYGVDEPVAKLLNRYGFDDVVRSRAWEEFDLSRRRLYTGLTMPAPGCCDYIMADFAGVLIIKRNYRFKNGFGNGWGHLGGSKFLFLLRSVSNVSPHACAGIPSDAAPPIPH